MASFPPRCRGRSPAGRSKRHQVPAEDVQAPRSRSGRPNAGPPERPGQELSRQDHRPAIRGVPTGVLLGGAWDRRPGRCQLRGRPRATSPSAHATTHPPHRGAPEHPMLCRSRRPRRRAWSSQCRPRRSAGRSSVDPRRRHRKRPAGPPVHAPDPRARQRRAVPIRRPPRPAQQTSVGEVTVPVGTTIIQRL